MRSARADAHRVQRRSAKLFPDWLKVSTPTTLHVLGTRSHMAAEPVVALVIVGV
jgi:hypothetical protein